jgi:hypothetical protein
MMHPAATREVEARAVRADQQDLPVVDRHYRPLGLEVSKSGCGGPRFILP